MFQFCFFLFARRRGDAEMVHPAARLASNRQGEENPSAEQTPAADPIPNPSASPRLRANLIVLPCGGWRGLRFDSAQSERGLARPGLERQVERFGDRCVADLAA